MAYVKKIGTKEQVLTKYAEKTKSGLREKDLTRNKKGKAVSKKKQAAGFRLAKAYPEMLFRKQK